MRRLITLISADWCRTIVIRRELPRTKNAGWVRRPYHLENTRILLSTRPRRVTDSVAIFKSKSKFTNHPADSAPSGDERPATTTGRPTPVRAEEARHPGFPGAPWPCPLRCGGASRKLAFDAHCNGPDKPQQFSPDGGHNLILVLSF
jgi:hypothetical protein